MITGNHERIRKNLEEAATLSLEKAYVGNFNIDLNSAMYTKVKEAITKTAADLANQVIESQVTDSSSPYVTGNLNKALVSGLAKTSAEAFFVTFMKYHNSYANGKIRDFSADFNVKIASLGRRWKAEVPKKTKKTRKKVSQ